MYRVENGIKGRNEQELKSYYYVYRLQLIHVDVEQQ